MDATYMHSEEESSHLNQQRLCLHDAPEDMRLRLRRLRSQPNATESDHPKEDNGVNDFETCCALYSRRRLPLRNQDSPRREQ